MKNIRKSVLIRSVVIAAIFCVLGLSWSLKDRLSGNGDETLMSVDSGNPIADGLEGALIEGIRTDAAASTAEEQSAAEGGSELLGSVGMSGTISAYPDRIAEKEKTEEKTEKDVSAASETPEENRKLIYVYVCGEVQKPGVYRCAADARVTDAVELAGGATEQAAALALNLAAPLQDGQMLWLPSQEEYETLRNDVQRPEGELPVCALSPDDGGTEKNAAADGRINLNTAEKEALMTLPGIGAQKAEKIIAYRTEHGGFGSAEEIKQIPGIKQKAYEKLKDRITVQ